MSEEELSFDEYFDKYIYESRENFENMLISALLIPYLPKDILAKEYPEVLKITKPKRRKKYAKKS